MDKPAPKVKEPSMANDNPERQERLAAALRANLRRRKAQSRAQDAQVPAEPQDDGDRPSREDGAP